jgi:hypothetical protein
VTLFDEVALMNDINAACGGAPTHPMADRSTPIEQSIEARLAKLADLRSKGLINEDEYISRRKRILDEV